MRIGLLDIAAAGAFFFVAALPSPTRPIKAQYTNELAALAPRIAEAQADVARRPSDGEAAARLTDLLVRARQTDWAIRFGVRATTETSPTRWRPMVAVSAAHADRLELTLAAEWAKKALEACDAVGADCPGYERGRLDMYVVALDAAIKSGADPKLNAKGMTEAVRRAVPLIRLGK